MKRYYNPKVYIYELIFVLYFWGFVLLRPILQYFQSYSTLILSLYTFTLLIFFVSYIIAKKNIKLGESVFFILTFFIIFFFDSIIRYNAYSFKYLYKFIYCGILPVLFLSKIKNIEKLIYYYVFFSLLAFILLGGDPIHGFRIFSDYMDYGFNLGLPVFIGLFLGYKYFKFKWMIFFLILNFLSILIYSNKSSLLTVIVFVFIYYLFIDPISKKRIVKLIIPISIILLLIYINIKSIALFIYDVFVVKLNVNSYSLITIKNYFLTKSDRVLFSGRIEIWNKAKVMISENLLFGHGIGSFQDRYGFYSHNIILDLLLFFGIVGFVTFLILIFYSLYKILKYNGLVRLLGGFLFSLWFPKLFFSTYFIADVGFWCFLSFPFICKYFENYENIDNVKTLNRSS